MLRPLQAQDMPALLDLWVDAWRAAYPAIDFESRRDWAREHFTALRRDGAEIHLAWRDGRIIGALAIHPGTHYLDQIVVATDAQGRGVAMQLLAQARRISPERIELHVNQDNARAIAFYRKNGFEIAGEDVNARSGAPVFLMQWRPGLQAASN
ncbi:MAG: GNAT family N-acetyltransferase [Pseudorhodoplanes sp.]